MPQQKRRPLVGIRFDYDENWIGGAYYIKNLIACLNLLPDDEKPELLLLSREEKTYEFMQSATAYPYMSRLRVRLSEVAEELSFDMIFPFDTGVQYQQTACWIPDFQDKHLPDFFSQEELSLRENLHRKYFQNFRHMVFSSAAARADFDRFYPEARVQKHVLSFAVFDDIAAVDGGSQVLAKYDLPERFFYCPNQFWIHKNHKTAIEAVAILKKQGVDVTLVFSGKEYDYRAPGNTENLKASVIEQGLESNVRFLGFIPREDQIVLFQRAICIVQPSLFEGWSTVIEDARQVSQYVLAACIPPNVEQIDTNVEFFEPLDADALAALMQRYAEHDPTKKIIDYQSNRVTFAQSFMRLLQDIMDDPAARKIERTDIPSAKNE